ncbi:dTDP-4-dehydrorhamnose reductase [Pseudolabrys sp.]|uniref:dTDP-4-dehydrorhamnose reductase n=1 Tax=Pseudolabrys sp. TaxID=1960880 RepID=UPI003D0AA193
MNKSGPILVVGREGQVARCLAERAAARGADLVLRGRPDLDLINPASVDAAVAAVRPRAIVNAAAFTAVDKAESEEASAFAVNETGAWLLATAAARIGVPFVHLSTDYVFDGRKPSPYVEDDATAPLGAYGRSKLAGEVAVRAAYPAANILRTAWVYSAGGTNFVRTMLRLAAERPVVRVVDDQTGNPTSALDLADAILTVLEGPKRGGKLYHVAGRGETTWYGFAKAIFDGWARRGRAVPQLEAITTAEYKTAAPRPANSRLDCAKIERELGIRLPDWQTSLEACLDRLAEAGDR